MRKTFDNILQPGQINVAREAEGSYVLDVGGNASAQQFDSVQSVWEALDEIDAPRRHAEAA